ncbi:hypothetical protein DWY33_11645 [Dorea formicigenerans]|uniref:Uncharacterized protein n=1 Tax=Dorea formicigenerans TaxID=39486 RepID=A0A412EYI5_9FIRM|nr:hypothetical protein DWY33_11645 [Dorea formicigenerans]
MTACLILSILKLQECLGILATRCASCNCMTYFYCTPLQVYTPFRSAQNHCPPDNVRPAGGLSAICLICLIGCVYVKSASF